MVATVPKSESIIDVLPPTKERNIEVLYRRAGDRWLQVEYEHVQRMDLLLNFRVIALNVEVKRRNVKGMIETVPHLRTLLVHYDPLEVSVEELVSTLKDAEQKILDTREAIIPSRLIELPLAFEDTMTKDAVARYTKSIRADAPNVIDGYNIKYIANYNGITVEEAKEKITMTQWWNASIAFWPGLPFLFPLDPRCAITTPKYNPPRLYTPEGTVGIGGPCVSIYSTESSGGYQLFGRTAPIYQFKQSHPDYKESPVLLKTGDRVKFYQVTEGELKEVYRLVHEEASARYRYDITTYEMISVKKYLEFLESIKEESEVFTRSVEEARKKVPVP